MPVYNRSGGGGATWMGWKENAAGIVFGDDIVKFDPVVKGIYGDWATQLDKIADSNIEHDAETLMCAVDFWGDYMAVGQKNLSLAIYKRGTLIDTFEFIETQPTQPTYSGYVSYEVKFSHDGKYLAYSNSNTGLTPFYLYKRDGDTFTALDLTVAFDVYANLQDYTALDITWSTDDKYLAICINSYLQIFKNNGDDTFTRLYSVKPSNSTPYSSAFSPDGKYLFCTLIESPYVYVYSIDGETDTFTALGDPSLGLTLGNCFSAEFSPDGNYVAFASQYTPYLLVYKFNAGTLTKLANPATLPAGSIGFLNDLCFDPSGKYIALTSGVTPFVLIYELDTETDTLTKIANPSTIPDAIAYGCRFSLDALYLAVTHNTASTAQPFITIYRTETIDMITKVSHFDMNPFSWLPNNNNLGVALQSGIAGEEIKINLFPKLNNMIEE